MHCCFWHLAEVHNFSFPASGDWQRSCRWPQLTVSIGRLFDCFQRGESDSVLGLHVAVDSVDALVYVSHLPEIVA